MSEPLFNFHDTILIATICLSGLFVVLILFARHERHYSDYSLAGFFLAQAAISLHVLINYGAAFRDTALAASPDLFYFFGIAFWLEGPLLFLYTRSLLYRNYTFKRSYSVYFLPSLAYIIYVSIIFYSLSFGDKIAHIETIKGMDAPSTQHFIEAIRESLRVFFGVLCILDIRKAQTNIRDRFSNIDKINLSWLTVLVISFVAVRVWILFIVFLSIGLPKISDPVFDDLGLAGNYLSFALVAMMMFYSLRSSPFVIGHVVKDNEAVEGFAADPALKLKIETYMSEQKPYLHHLLNLDQLSSGLEMNPRALSAVIKHSFQTNFYEFVNSYRIDEAKSILDDPREIDKTMIEIAGECGFNSKATYNTFFKKLAGCTPTEYRKKSLKKGKVANGK